MKNSAKAQTSKNKEDKNHEWINQRIDKAEVAFNSLPNWQKDARDTNMPYLTTIQNEQHTMSESDISTDQ